jgi:hypothetical protein
MTDIDSEKTLPAPAQRSNQAPFRIALVVIVFFVLSARIPVILILHVPTLAEAKPTVRR